MNSVLHVNINIIDPNGKKVAGPFESTWDVGRELFAKEVEDCQYIITPTLEVSDYEEGDLSPGEPSNGRA
ncbi:MAG: hypothetical protein JSU72_15790 [Deltaproteobacteria bacterium]|nr:MAG: hypothetical protein JSU72_15790 [Deltaproteobacteria bacterium]